MRSLLQFLGWGNLTVFAFLLASGVPVRQALANTLPAVTNCNSQCSCTDGHASCLGTTRSGCNTTCKCASINGLWQCGAP